MAQVENYEPEELEVLDLLICTTNRSVCKWCLQDDCNGDCGEVSPAMASAKAKFFSDGSYEQVLLAKEERQHNQFGHSPFSRDSYLSTRPMGSPEGANTEDDGDRQENISIMAKPRLSESEAELLQASIAEDRPNKGYESDKSSVDEDFGAQES